MSPLENSPEIIIITRGREKSLARHNGGRRDNGQSSAQTAAGTAVEMKSIIMDITLPMRRAEASSPVCAQSVAG